MAKICAGTWDIVASVFWEPNSTIGAARLINNLYQDIEGFTLEDDPIFVQPLGLNTPSYLISSIDPSKSKLWSFQGRVVLVSKTFDRGVCRCSNDSCRIDCANEPDGFCCIDHSFISGLLNELD